ncbi:GNAT family N-acetyltransferase [uncultured Gimesia sp.]|uniref:GNAT family N-acetyltransferase n=1 Tax=uncultured Gimesia sp. TaxID=1678688 RepID=UPI0030DCD73A|tara:strand:+ start:47949 stop:49214 length:1266 start_codon:yes stop_codon:yes gene_type:complete
MKTKSDIKQLDHSDSRQAESPESIDGQPDLQIVFSALHSLSLQPVSEIYQSWLQLFDAEPHADLHQHPDHVTHLIPIFKEMQTHHPGYLMQCRKEGALVAVGILLPKNINTKTLKAIGPARTLPGYYLCGNRFLMQQNIQQDESILKNLLEAALNFCQKQHATFLLLEDILVDAPLSHSIQNTTNHFLTYSHTGFQNRSLIHFPDPPEDYWNQFRSKSRRKHRKLLRQNSEMQMIRITEPDQVVDFLEAAHQISLNTWQTQRLGLRIKNDEKELEELTFLALNGWLRSYLLMKDDQPVAFKIGSQHRGVYRDLEFGFDLNYASTSPGETLLLLILEDLIQYDTPQTYDFGEGDAEYKKRYSSQITQSCTVMLLPSTIKNKVRLSYFKSSRFIDHLIRKFLKASGVYTALRQMVRYGKMGSR